MFRFVRRSRAWVIRSWVRIFERRQSILVHPNMALSCHRTSVVSRVVPTLVSGFTIVILSRKRSNETSTKVSCDLVFECIEQREQPSKKDSPPNHVAFLIQAVSVMLKCCSDATFLHLLVGAETRDILQIRWWFGMTTRTDASVSFPSEVRSKPWSFAGIV